MRKGESESDLEQKNRICQRCNEGRNRYCREDVDQWQICEIVVDDCWSCMSRKALIILHSGRIGDVARNVLFESLF